jgi:hypothetical protein
MRAAGPNNKTATFTARLSFISIHPLPRLLPRSNSAGKADGGHGRQQRWFGLRSWRRDQ